MENKNQGHFWGTCKISERPTNDLFFCQDPKLTPRPIFVMLRCHFKTAISRDPGEISRRAMKHFVDNNQYYLEKKFCSDIFKPRNRAAISFSNSEKNARFFMRKQKNHKIAHIT